MNRSGEYIRNMTGEAEYRSHGLSYRQLEKHSEVLSAEELS